MKTLVNPIIFCSFLRTEVLPSLKSQLQKYHLEYDHYELIWPLPTSFTGETSPCTPKARGSSCLSIRKRVWFTLELSSCLTSPFTLQLLGLQHGQGQGDKGAWLFLHGGVALPPRIGRSRELTLLPLGTDIASPEIAIAGTLFPARTLSPVDA